VAGQRFYDETQGQFPANNYNSIKSYIPRSYRNAADIKYETSNFINAALAGTEGTAAGGGPIWAIFEKLPTSFRKSRCLRTRCKTR
jgi:hypothetical protein